MGSYIRFLADQMEFLRRSDAAQTTQQAKLKSEIRKLKAEVAKLQIGAKEKQRLNERVRAVTASSETTPPLAFHETFKRMREQAPQRYAAEFSNDAVLAAAVTSASKAIADAARHPLSATEIHKLFPHLAERSKR